MAVHHVKTKPRPPSQKTDQSIPPEFEKLVLACLEKDPDDRPSSALDLARQVESIGLAADWTAERAETWCCFSATIGAVSRETRSKY